MTGIAARAAAVLVVPLLALSACGDDEPTSQEQSSPSAAASIGSAPDPDPPAPEVGDAEAYARIVMGTSMKDLFSGYEIDGSTIRFSLTPGAVLDDAQCQYLKLSNGALREAAGVGVVVDVNGTDKEC